MSACCCGMSSKQHLTCIWQRDTTWVPQNTHVTDIHRFDRLAQSQRCKVQAGLLYIQAAHASGIGDPSQLKQHEALLQLESQMPETSATDYACVA